MIRLKLFTKPDCPNCPQAKLLIDEIEHENLSDVVIERYDVSTLDGLTEATFYTVQATPSILLVDENGTEKMGWRGEVPTKTVMYSLVGHEH